MKITKGKNDRDVEEIYLLDGPCANEIIKIEIGKPFFLVAIEPERPSVRYITFTHRAYNLNIDREGLCKVEYTRSARQDDEGRVYFTVK